MIFLSHLSPTPPPSNEGTSLPALNGLSPGLDAPWSPCFGRQCWTTLDGLSPVLDTPWSPDLWLRACLTWRFLSRDLDARSPPCLILRSFVLEVLSRAAGCLYCCSVKLF